MVIHKGKVTMLFSSLQLLIMLTYVTDKSIPMPSAVDLPENDVTFILKKMPTYGLWASRLYPSFTKSFGITPLILSLLLGGIITSLKLTKNRLAQWFVVPLRAE